MAPTPAAYDPLKSLEGMWNGSLIRLANYFKDPASYGQQTQTVLRETAKRYQDALDDCEIQILEAKWYLENQLALNRARRAQQASEGAHTGNKRKLDMVNDQGSGDAENAEDQPAKRTKVHETKDGDTLVAKSTPAQIEDARRAVDDNPPKPAVEIELLGNTGEGVHETGQEAEKSKVAAESSEPTITPPNKPPNINTTDNTDAAADSTAQKDPKTSEPTTSADDNQNFNFDSMFDDPNDGGDANNTDLGFDMDLGADPFASVINDSNNSGQADKSASLDSLLPGLENYANQAGDDMLMNFNSTGTAGATSNPFDLPDLGDSTFDDLLNDESLGVNLGGTAEDDMLNDDSMLNLGEFDDSFFDP